MMNLWTGLPAADVQMKLTQSSRSRSSAIEMIQSYMRVYSDLPFREMTYPVSELDPISAAIGILVRAHVSCSCQVINIQPARVP